MSDDMCWPVYEGRLEQQLITNDSPNTKHEPISLGGSTNKDEDCYNNKFYHTSDNVTVEQQDMETKPRVLPKLDEGLGKMKEISSTNSNNNKWREIIIANTDVMLEGGSSSRSLIKKMDHNVKEKMRRMQINASYDALRALLPDSSRRSQRKWSAPSVVDSVLEYIPKLENEIEDLESKKQQLVQSVSLSNENKPKFSRLYSTSPTVSITRVNEEDEAIVQICMDAKAQRSAFANLLQRVEDEGLCVNSASTLYVPENISTSHLHIKMNGVLYGSEYITELKDKFISWLT